MNEDIDKEPQESSGKDKPLLPATPTSAAIVAIPLASVLAFAGWTGQKLLEVDEVQQQHETRLNKLAEVQDEIRQLGNELSKDLVRVSQRQDSQQPEFDEIGDLGNRISRIETTVDDSIDDRLTAAEITQGVITEEVERLRNRVEKMRDESIQFLLQQADLAVPAENNE